MFGSRLITALLIVFWIATPDLLCLIPGVEMTVDEHECCEQMGSDCGKVPMPDMETCCRPAPHSNAVIIGRNNDYPELRGSIDPFITPDLDLPHSNVHSIHWLRFESPIPPPLLRRDSVEILRI
jgi:hypothetical protein